MRAPLAERLTIAGTNCPKTMPALPQGRTTSQGMILPSDVRALRLCRVERLLNGPQPSVKARLVGNSRAKRMVQELDDLPVSPSGPINCPAELGNDIVILGVAAGDRTPVVKVELDGCLTVTNGRTYRWMLGGTAIARRLDDELSTLMPVPRRSLG